MDAKAKAREKIKLLQQRYNSGVMRSPILRVPSPVIKDCARNFLVTFAPHQCDAKVIFLGLEEAKEIFFFDLIANGRGNASLPLFIFCQDQVFHKVRMQIFRDFIAA
jgi:hypothetical protein